MTKPTVSSSKLRNHLHRKSEPVRVPTPQASIPLAGPSLEKLKLKALLNPCLTAEEASLQAHIDQDQLAQTENRAS